MPKVADLERTTDCCEIIAGTGVRERAGGNVIIELAFTMPILAILILLAVDLGLIVHEHQILQNAAREGARYSILPVNSLQPPADPVGAPCGAPCAPIRQYVVNYCQQERITINLSNVSVTQKYPIAVGGLTVYGSQVTVTYTRAPLSMEAPFLPGTPMQLTATAVFRNLY